MLSIVCCRRLIRAPRNDAIFAVAHFSSFNLSSNSAVDAAAVDGGDGGGYQSFTLSYLTDSCGLSEKAAISAFKKLPTKSLKNPDAVLNLLREYGFTDAQIPKLVARWPGILQCSPQKTLFPKLEFFRSIGVPDHVAAEKITTYTVLLKRSLEKHLIPSYDYLKSVVKYENKVSTVFSRAPMVFSAGWPKVIPSIIAILSGRGLPDSSIASLMVNRPNFFLYFSGEKVNSFVDRATEMGFDVTKIAFVSALQVFAKMSDRALQRKIAAYRSCGWSENEIGLAFLSFPSILSFSEEKIRRNMDFLVKELGFKPADIALRPVLIGLSVEKRMRPRWAVFKVLRSKKLLKKSITMFTFLMMSEKMFVEKYVVGHEEKMPLLSDMYRHK